MMRLRFAATAAVLAALAALMAGCITLLPKTPPAQLYRFGADQGAPAAPAAGRRFAVRAAAITFETASASDQILTVEGDKTAYIGGARWITSAVSLFESAVSQAFAAQGASARLLARGEAAQADYVLKLDVRRFEARYDHGLGAPPIVGVEVYAALDSPLHPDADRQRVFQASARADDNRVGAIVAAYDHAVSDALVAMVRWVDAKGEG